MGRGWLYKASGGGDGGHRSCSSRRGGGGKSTTSASGCMSAIICNLFDIQHHHHRPSNNFISHDESSTLSTSFSLLQAGIQPPRNSLEDQSPEFKQLSHYIPPVGRIHEIETKRSTFSDDDDTSTPVTKTPNVVARLMGLDLLPEYSSPRPSSSSDHHRTHSLPPTPSRLSTASPDHNHRLSLHVDKENYNHHDDVTSHKKIVRRRRSEAPVKQQNSRIINRRVVGTDITNTMSTNTRNIKHRRRRDSNLDVNNFSPKQKVSPPARGKTPSSKNNLNKEMKLSKTRAPKWSHDQTTPLKLPKDTKIIKRIAGSDDQKEFCSRKKTGRLPADRNCVFNVRNRRNEDVASSSLRLSQKQVSFPRNLIWSYNSSSRNYHKPTAACCFSVDGDLRLWPTAAAAFEGEVEGIVMETQSEIFKNLVDEIVTEMMTDRVRSHVLFT